MNASYHTPVLYESVLSGLRIKQDAWYIDCTLGGGGYSVGILRLGGKIIGIDTDTEALTFAEKRISTEIPDKKKEWDWVLIHDNFRNIKKIVADLGNKDIQGILFDLGVSSHQLDTPERGFSFRYPEGPFDLRLDQTRGRNGVTIINTYSREDLYDILTRFGEEERAWSIVDSIVSARRIKKIETVADLLVAIGRVGTNGKDGMLSRVFQAFRIEVNDELGALKEGLQGSKEILKTGGRLAVISFHSLEDRITKQFFRHDGFTDITDLITATESERRDNRRSRSAKLRIGEKL